MQLRFKVLRGHGDIRPLSSGDNYSLGIGYIYIFNIGQTYQGRFLEFRDQVERAVYGCRFDSFSWAQIGRI